MRGVFVRAGGHLKDDRMSNSHAQALVQLAAEIAERERVAAELNRTNDRLAEAVERLAERTLDMELFNEFSEALMRADSMEDACAEAVRVGMELFASAAGKILLLPFGETGLVDTGNWARGASLLPAISLEQLTSTERAVTEIHTLGADRKLRKLEECEGSATLVIPLFVRNELHGAVLMRPAAVALPRKSALTTYCKHLAMALSNIRLRERLRDQSLRDPLTRLYNRRYFEEAFNRELKRSERHHAPLSVVMVDLDHFKRINDSFGHDVGDEVLRAMGRMLPSQLRSEDTVCRLGGEEFVAILPSTSAEQAMAVAEKLRAATRELRFREIVGLQQGISCSLGVATYPQHGEDCDALLQAADAALYVAKNGGRNRAELAGRPH
jgi:diguanylate cyclase (GGDEF)-like protein